MSFKDILSKLDQLSEGETKDTEKGRIHKGDYGRHYDTDEEGDEKKKDKVKADTAKRGRGRPKKDSDETGEVKKYDTKHLHDVFGGGKKPKKDIGKTSKKHSLKEYFDRIDEMMTQQPIPVVSKQGQTQSTGAGFLNIDDNSPAGQAMKDAIGKMAQQKKAQIVMPTAQQQSGTTQQKPTATSGGATNQPAMAEEGEKWIQKAVKHPGAFSAKAKAAGKSVAAFAKEKAHAPGTLGKQARLAQTLRKMHEDEMTEGDIPPQDGLMGAGLGAGRSQGVTEAAKPDFLDLDKDGNKKESMKKAASDAKKKKKVDESMDNRLKAAHHAGKSHALSKQSYNCHYDDMEEARMYHEGYKEGLDECYGQVPIRGNIMADESSTVDNMASFGAHTPTMEDDMEEGNAFTAALAKTPHGGKFSVGGKTFTDRSNYDAKVDEMSSMFESWDNQLSSLLTEYSEIQEGLSVSVSKGQQGSPDTVSVTAQDGDADKLLQLVKHAGLGLFGDEQKADVGVPSGDEQHGGVNVVGDHDGMMALIKKVTGGDMPGTLEPAGSEDYADEEGHDHEHTDEEVCGECSMPMEQCGCDHEEALDEVESEDQMTYNVAEDNPPDTGAQEFATMDQEVATDNAAASSHGGAQNSNLEEEDKEDEEEECPDCHKSPCECDDEDEDEEDDEEEDLDESYANSPDDGFEADIEYMTKMISGGLNKPKSTGQTTIPVIAGQNDREGYSVSESITDWKKLAGLK
jgi:hypothetical protein